MSKTTTVRGVLLAAARRLERRPWYQVRHRGGNIVSTCTSSSAECALDALYSFFVDRPRQPRAPDHVIKEAQKRIEALVGSTLPTWNDAPGRTKREVIATFRKAAK